MIFLFKSKDYKAVNHTIKLLAKFHGVTEDNEQFYRRYSHLLTLRIILEQKRKK